MLFALLHTLVFLKGNQHGGFETVTRDDITFNLLYTLKAESGKSILEVPDTSTRVSRVDTDVLMEVVYSCNFLAVSDSSTCPDIGTS